MRDNYKQIKDIINEEKRMYIPTQYGLMKWSHQKRYLIFQCLSSFRMMSFFKAQLHNTSISGVKKIYAKLAYHYYSRKRNLFGEKAGVEIASHSVLGRRLDIWHGGVIISGQLGDDCIIHGNNVIGNNGKKDTGIPTIGNRVDLGVGAVVIGNIRVADDCKIGANAVVTKDFLEPNKVIVGVPAKVKE